MINVESLYSSKLRDKSILIHNKKSENFTKYNDGSRW